MESLRNLARICGRANSAPFSTISGPNVDLIGNSCSFLRMARPCSICTGPLRDAVDKAFASRMTGRKIAAQFGITRQIVDRHKLHVRAEIRAARERHQDDLVGMIADSHARITRIIRRNMQAKLDDTALKGLKERRELLTFEHGSKTKVTHDFEGMSDAELELRWKAAVAKGGGT
jgi:hypothetical protein